MRWFVEVSRVGDSTLAERYCVEAKAWQAALQETRKLRGDSGPLSKFSIELLDDGYRAVDPVQKIRYLVNQAPGDAPLVMPQVNGTAYGAVGASVPPAAGPSSPPTTLAAASVAPMAPTLAPAAAVRAAPAAPVAPAGKVATPGPVASLASAAPGTSAVPTASMVSAAGGVAAVGAGSSAAAAPAAPATKKVIAVQLGAGSSPTASTAPTDSAPAGGAPRPSPRRSGGHKAATKGGALEAKAAVPGASLAPATPSPPVAVGTEPTPAPAPVAHIAPVIGVAPVVSAASVVSAAPVVASAPVVVNAAPAAQPKQSAEPRAPGVPEFEVFSSRVQEPTPEAPIVYRELACAVAPGIPREAVEALLRDRLRAARADFSTRPPGQLVQIAVFDHVFQERPQRAPLGTLAWKDWRGEPILGYPAFGEAAPPTTPSLPPAPIVPVETGATAGSTVATAPEASEPAGATPGEAAPSAAAEPTPAEPALAKGAPAPAESEDAEQPVLLRRPASRPDIERGSQPRIARRRAGEDLISELFESMHELHFARDLALGADFVIGILEQVLPCEAMLIQVFDINTRNFVVVRGRGGGAQRAVLHRTPDNDPLTSEIMRRDRARAYRTEADARFAAGRWGVVGLPLREVLCGAVRQGGRYLGMIELANPLGGAPFHENEVNALDYICEQFADFVASRPVVLEPDVILGR